MSELVGHILKKIYTISPTQVLEEPEHLLQMLQESCPDEEKAIRMVLMGLDNQVPHTLLASPTEQLKATMKSLALQLSQSHAMHLRFGLWLVQTWARALDLLPLNLNPVNIFAEAEQEYRQALKAVFSTQASPGEQMRKELAIMQQQLLLSDEQVVRLEEEVKQSLRLNQELGAPAVATLQEPEFNRLGMGFLKVSAGRFMMGSAPHEYQREADEAQHEVTLTHDFYLQTHPVTQSQWQKVMGNNPSDFKGPNLPVDNVSWNEIVTQFIPRLNAREEGAYRLPTEAEWEYVARAGGNQAYGHYEDVVNLDRYAWYNNNAQFQTHPVGTKEANPWGFYDMQGNVWEWCQDWYNGPYGTLAQLDPLGSQAGPGRVMRGGSWFGGSESCRCAARGYMAPETRIRLIGFRLVKKEA